MVERITISMDEELHDKITDELDYGDSMSEWMREAVELRFEEEGKNQSAVVARMSAD